MMREQLKIWFQSIQSRTTDVEMYLEESEYKTEIAIIGKNHAASIEMTGDSTCDLSLIRVGKDEIVSFKSVIFTDSHNLNDELNQLLSRVRLKIMDKKR